MVSGAANILYNDTEYYKLGKYPVGGFRRGSSLSGAGAGPDTSSDTGSALELVRAEGREGCGAADWQRLPHTAS